MDSKDDREESKVDWASYHESTNQPVDVSAFTALVRRVGGELTEIDKQSISNSTKPALQINKEQIIRELSATEPPRSASSSNTDPKPPPIPPIGPGKQENVTPVRVTPPPPPLPINQDDLTVRIEALEKKITRIESFNRAYQKVRKVKRGAKIWIRVFPDKPITKKPLEVRQGKGKGNVEYWVCPIKPGKILYEMEGVEEELAKEAFALASAKMPVATTFVRRV